MINYLNIHDSIEFYEKKGFTRIESPWTVSPAVSNITKPEFARDFEIKHNGKVLVASGEQSFLYLYLKEFLPKGRFQTVTPCFRDETFDDLHTKYFVKNELIITDDVSLIRLDEIISICEEFFTKKLGSCIRTATKSGFDLSYKGIEIGSYGIRECEFLKWIYATGCAEPRLSYCQNKK